MFSSVLYTVNSISISFGLLVELSPGLLLWGFSIISNSFKNFDLLFVYERPGIKHKV